MDDGTRDHSRVTPQGRALGEQMVRITERTLAELEREGQPDHRCKSCAFRHGTIPNGCAQTQLDTLKAVVEGVAFLCHQADRSGRACHGWYAARVAMGRAEALAGKPLPVPRCPWPFSPDDGGEAGES